MMININNENYYSNENALKFMSASQFKSFQNCETKALAEINGEYTRKSETALLVGSYVDSYFEGTLGKFKEKHPDIFLKSGGLKAEFRKAEECIERATSDDVFMHYMSGEKQKIVTGTIENVAFKGKLDSYIPHEAIVDLKCMRGTDDVWKDGKKMHWIEAYGYDIQLAIYQELVFQETNERLRCYIAVVTKEDVPDIQVLEIPQQRLDICLKIVKDNVELFDKIKHGDIEASRCEKCDYCRATKKLKSAVPYREFAPTISQPAIKLPKITSTSDSSIELPKQEPIIANDNITSNKEIISLLLKLLYKYSVD